MEFIQQDLDDQIGLANYSSVSDFAAQVSLCRGGASGHGGGPPHQTTSGNTLQLPTRGLCPGPLAAIDEGDEIRTIYDGSAGGANTHIQNQTMERTTAPTVLDSVQSLTLAP